MNDGILLTVKKSLGISEDDPSFDGTILMHINSVIMILSQLGVGPDGGYFVTGEDDQWADYVSDDRLPMVKTYICMKVRSIFDPPTIGAVSEALKNTIAELEWRLNVAVDPGEAE